MSELFVLPHEVDRFNGVIADLVGACPPVGEFSSLLKYSLDEWSKAGRRGVWIKIGVADSACISLADELGFKIHHAQDGYIMMTKWLPTDEPNLLPGFATHYIGAGGLVINDKNQLLVVKEIFSFGKARWKLPGGLMDADETFSTAVMREVLEETNIQTEFVSIVMMRLTSARFKRGDLYLACHLRPTSFEIKACKHEISDCRWMDIEEYLSLGSIGEVYDMNYYVVQSYVHQQSQMLALTETKIGKSLYYTPQLGGKECQLQAPV